MDRVLAERKVVRTRFTLSCKKLESFLDSKAEESAISEFDKLEKHFQDLNLVENKLLAAWLDTEDRDEEFYEKDTEVTSQYETRFHILKNQIKKAYQSVVEEGTVRRVKSDSNSVDSAHRRFRLPELQPRMFDGQVKHWLHFWAQFKKIDADSSIDREDKFQYLLQSIEPGCSARDLVESFPPSAENYPKVIDQLKQRYARDELVIEHYVRELLKLTVDQSKNSTKLSIRALYDKLMTQILSLESLGVTKDKYAAFLLPMVESALPEDILRAWNRSHLNSHTSDHGKTKLTTILDFLRAEVESEERIVMARGNNNHVTPSTSFLTTSVDASEPKKGTTNTQKSNENNCVWCDRPSHNSSECKVPIKWSLDDKKVFLNKKKACLICLKVGHFAKRCRKFPKCLICEKRHYPIICSDLIKVTAKTEKQSTEKVMLQQATITVKLNIVHKEKVVTVRALLDSGAQRSFVKSDIITKLKAKPNGQEYLRQNLFGGVVTNKEVHNAYLLDCKSLDGNFTFQLNALEQQIICKDLPIIRPGKLLSILMNKGIEPIDCINDCTEISLLIGSDVLGSLYTGRSEHVSENLVAIETRFGWVLQGPASGMYCTFVDYITTQKCSFDIEDLWKLETLGIKDEAEVKSTKAKELEVEQFFKQTIRVDHSDRYEVRLPWKDTAGILSPNYHTALKRLYSTTAKLTKLGLLVEYDKVFGDWVNNKIIEEVLDDDTHSGHYLPHHAVVKEASQTTKIRPVFDASATTKEGFSLNSCLEKGSNLIELIPRLLIQFRKNAIGITADIKQAFLQLSLHPDDRKYVKFLWWQDLGVKNKVLKVFRHCRVVFGVTTSPYLLAATILHHIGKYTGKTADQLKTCFYVDNCIISVNDKCEMDIFIDEAKAIMNEGKFELRCWVTGPVITDEAKESIAVLGINWDPVNDNLHCKVPFVNCGDMKLTKRTLLSMVQSVFDPIGYLCPITIVPRLLIQKCWERGIDWDKELPDEIEKQVRLWLKHIDVIEKCKIPRRISSHDLGERYNTLHTFSDASQSAYSGCVFLRSEKDGVVSVQLIIAKSRVAPVKSVTMPRLELIAALMATRLASEVKSSLRLNCREYYWCDSSIVIAWIKRKTGLNVFVHNRVNEILTKTDSNNWRHVPGENNPADLPSRGCTAQHLVDTHWWEGPAWLKHAESIWPNVEVSPDENEVNKEVKRSFLTVHEADCFSERYLNFEKYSKIIRTVAWCLRFGKNCQKKYICTGNITAIEYEHAEIELLKIIQREEFGSIEGINERLSMEVFKDKSELIRVKTRLGLSKDLESFIYPILLPSSNIIIQRLVRQKHVMGHHTGSQALISNLREQYWIIGVRRLAKKVVKQCVVCRRYNVKACTVPSAPLPADRVDSGVPFEVTGTDLAGPILLKDGSKCWIIIFTCATYRAIHLDICNALSMEEFVLALRRFIARKGRPKTIYSDNGSNFRGAYNLLNTIPAMEKISWRFIPPLAPWWGGWWERMVRSVKEMLRRELGKAAVKHEELYTILCEVEAQINSRPLTYIADNTEGLMALTPAMFLQPNITTHTQDLDNFNSTNLTARYRYMKKLTSDLKQRFRNEYLAHLTQKRSERNYNLKVGDVVLIGSDDLKRVNWPLGLILEVIPGSDKENRVARVKTAHGERIRAFQRLYPLELSLTQASQSLMSKEHKLSDSVAQTPPKSYATRSGRSVKIPSRLGL